MFDVTIVSLAWALYALIALFLLVVALRVDRSLGTIGLALLLLQQAAGTICAFILFTATDATASLMAFHAGALAWLLWSPIVFLVAPLLLSKTPHARVAWLVGGLGAAPSALLVGAGFVNPSVVFTPDRLAFTPLAVSGLLLVFLAFSVSIALLIWEAFATPAPMRRAAFALLASALAAEGAFHVAQNATKLVAGFDFHAASSGTRLDLALTIAPLAILALVAAWCLAVSARAVDPERRKWAHFVAAVIALAALSGALTAPLLEGEEFVHPSGLIHAAWDLGALCMLVFAALRYRLVGVEWQAKRGVAVSSAVVLGALLFLGVQEVLADILADLYLGGVPAASVVAGTVVGLGSLVLTRVGQRVARRVFPNVEASPSYERRRRDEIYRAAVEGALLDGTVTPSEANALRRLRDALGITMEDHVRIEALVRKSLGGALSSPAVASRPRPQ